MAHYFLIPQELEYDLLPSPHLSIATMLEFPLPLQSTRAITGFQPAKFFNKNPPDINDRDLRIRLPRLPIPDAKTIHKLLAGSRQRFLDGFRSVLYSHVGGTASHYPLRILTYWESVSALKGDVWANFRKSRDWVTARRKLPPQIAVKRARFAGLGGALSFRLIWAAFFIEF
ncbi:hypothetical protein C8R45DRAFT_1188150 [Mycena sanguinolenta]|nr:hypothetical protein C8R45DRAFT_1188150 [Mycena sanguinolenta]